MACVGFPWVFAACLLVFTARLSTVCAQIPGNWFASSLGPDNATEVSVAISAASMLVSGLPSPSSSPFDLLSGAFTFGPPSSMLKKSHPFPCWKKNDTDDTDEPDIRFSWHQQIQIPVNNLSVVLGTNYSYSLIFTFVHSKVYYSENNSFICDDMNNSVGLLVAGLGINNASKDETDPIVDVSFNGTVTWKSGDAFQTSLDQHTSFQMCQLTVLDGNLDKPLHSNHSMVVSQLRMQAFVPNITLGTWMPVSKDDPDSDFSKCHISDSSLGSGLSVAAIAGISIGSVFLLGLIVYYARKNKSAYQVI